MSVHAAALGQGVAALALEVVALVQGEAPVKKLAHTRRLVDYVEPMYCRRNNAILRSPHASTTSCRRDPAP
jgi:hypothetical protein